MTTNFECAASDETTDETNAREWSEFKAELVSGYNIERKLHIEESDLWSETSADKQRATVFAFGAYGSTYVAVFYDVNPYHGRDVCADLELAAAVLLSVAPGCFCDDQIAETYNARVDAMREEGLDVDNDDAARDSAHNEATEDCTYTESGYLPSHEWTIIGENMTREAVLAFARGE